MGKFLQKGNDGFRAVRNSEFVDKSGLIQVINSTLNTERQFTCVSRARRFGKSITAKMLYAYYDQWCDSKELFQDLQIAHSPSFQQHFQRYPVLYLDMTDFMTRYEPEHIVGRIQLDVIAEFEKISGIDVVYNNYETNEDLYAKLSARNTEMHLKHLTDIHT